MFFLYQAFLNKLCSLKIIVLGDSLKDGGRGNPSCAEHQNLEFAAGQAYFCRQKGRYVVITVDTGDRVHKIYVQEMLVNPSKQSKIQFESSKI